MPLNEDQEAALQRLVASGELTAPQAEAVRREFDAVAQERPAKIGWLVEVAGYVGGGLILGGVALFLGTAWDELGKGWQTAILTGMALLFIGAAVAVAEGPRQIRELTGARRRVVGVLLSLTAIPAAFAAAVAANDQDPMWGFITGLVVSIGCLLVVSTGLGVAIAAGMSIGAVLTVAEEVFKAGPSGTGVALLVLGALWAAVTLAGWVKPRTLGLVIGFGLAIIGAQLPLADNGTEVLAYVLTLAVAAGCLVLYRWERSLMTLAGGVVALTLGVPEIISDVTDGALGGAAVLLIAGVVLVASSALGMRFHKSRATQQESAQPPGSPG